MTSGQGQKPISPFSVSGPASSPTSDSLTTLAADPDLAVRLIAAGSLATQAGYEQARAKSSREPNYPWAIFAYLAIVVVAIVIYCLPSATADYKNQALGFLFGQATLILSFIFKNKDKD